ncbi:MAG: nitrous oxide reductase family maturation protein NosD [Flavobacteriales bacterium CG_4_10_14_0_2_um_filter_32_8]|nr:MAG: nitrous oxide reductase family maturation protein NosD [Flavobacteriales bacterium CG_4_10_14_0_2_um_filter_32_8]PJB15856.1 MAG: nitrous oxide reductase family maturation protein NosD [Flavobacteriales bacterium CG_4_9_14_3_um_filter_32_8]
MRNILFIAFLIFVFSLHAKQIEVCATCTIKSLKKAVEIAKSGDEIVVKKGFYKESNIVITKPVTIRGENNPIIDGGGLNYIFQIKSDSVTISGLKLQNVQANYTKDLAAIYISKSKYFTINNNTLSNIFFGILIEKSQYGEIKNNAISSITKQEYNSGNGIHLWNCNHMMIHGNKVSEMRDGIYLEFTSKSKIYNNISTKNIRYGLHFMFSDENEYYNNIFANNGAGVAVMFSKFIKIYRNKFVKNWGSASYGLLLKEINDAQLFDNVFDENTIGINTEGCSRINYKYNIFIRNGWAVKVSGACYANKFRNNNFISNAFNLSFNGRINDSDFDGNFWDDYAGYDLDKDGVGDVPYRPVKLFSYIVNKSPETIVLLRSLFVDMINFSEKVAPVFTPDNLLDNNPLMNQVK